MVSAPQRRYLALVYHLNKGKTLKDISSQVELYSDTKVENRAILMTSVDVQRL